MERKEPTHSKDPIHGVSSSSTSPDVDDRNDYEVFLNFRGKDTRQGFADYLYESLVNAGIHVSMIDNELHVGEDIGPESLYVITRCMISIPIISKDYASSKWCLRELAQMLKCRRSKGQIVLPIFYKVKPSQLRHLTGWEGGLTEVCFLEGWELEKIDNRRETASIVVEKVLHELKRLFLAVPKQLVGINEHVEKIMKLINDSLGGTSIIGIYGMGGIGKTTLAKVLYDKLSSRFEYLSFVANIRETSQHKGIECLQKQLISDITGSSYDVSNVTEGIKYIKSELTHKKVIILLDDMDASTNLNALAGDTSWFKPGSIVIITTRNKSILNEIRASYMYHLNELSVDHSLTLFSRHAFRRDFPQSGYEFISHDVISSIGGLPLALEVIGSFLHGKKAAVWKDTSKKLERVPNWKVQEVLRISYEALTYEEKQIFLDIACFFIGSSKQSPTYMWDACDFSSRKGIEVLSLMSLIKINQDGKLIMHDQLRDLGREIVRLEYSEKSQEQSRLWIYEEAVDVLDSNKGTSNIEALSLDKYGWRRRFKAEQFRELTNLRFLYIHGVNLLGDFQNVLPELRWLRWQDCPLNFEATNFQLKQLVVLDLSQSKIQEDWGGWGPLKMATKLKVLNLTGCQYLIRSPDLSTATSLEILILEDCKNLEELHPSIGDMNALVSLNVRRCGKLKKLPAGVGRMEELRELILDETAIQEIPISRGCLTKLQTLCASYCRRLAQLPKSMDSITSLSQLDLSHSNIQELPQSMASLLKLTQLDLSHSSIKELPEFTSSLVSLTQLDLSHSRIRELPQSMGSLVLLTQLNLSHSGIEELPESVGSLKWLTKLDLSHSRIHKLPESMGFLRQLTKLDLSHSEIRELPESMGFLRSLTKLDLSHSGIQELPRSVGFLKSLIKLDLSLTQIKKLPKSMGSLVSLIELDLSHSWIEELPESMGFLRSLTQLDLSHSRLKKLPKFMSSLMSLTQLDLSLTQIKELPKSIDSLMSLTKLDLSFSGIDKLPETMGFLRSLTQLDLSNSEIEKLPETIGSLTSLTQLDLSQTWIEEIPKSMSSLTLLTCLDLSNSGIREFPDSIRFLKSLIQLDLSQTGIEELPESISSLKKLQTLDASWCGLASIHRSISHLASLSLLDLRQCNKLDELPDSIGSVESLQHLLLGGCCSLKEIPYSIGRLTSLVELDLKYTAITELPDCIRGLQNLSTLDICGTHITIL